MRLATPRSHDNSPYYFGLALLAAVVGFYPSFFSQLGKLDLLRHVHGGLATSWLVLLIIQGSLARTRLYAVHRVLGWASLAIVPAFVISGVMLIRVSLAGTNPFQQAFAPPLALVDFIGLAFFAFCYGMALWHRRRMPLHARYMACTALLVLPPATARALGAFMPGIQSFEAAFHGGMLISVVATLVLIVRDAREGKILPPYPLLLAVLVVQQVSFMTIAMSPAWRAICARLAAG
ncbi:hypothetical protein SAMN05428989_0541 [Pseudoxanthomonas sp. GM95]|uniref:hypothetical protein n=1 Tax=Pseudoxanthomonas sp. GM95 TaxID=1881043 RepID=UPI0008D4F499|nr:hypothetical protein [Pseudoxanthomonas sp. GM95]SEK65259.1 hypothetical protein SAMN05428989_0541 [Pseudoxanthomonas sp. GM95]